MNEYMEAAVEAGSEAGRDAAQWALQYITGGRCDPDAATLARIVQGIDDCDPEIMDALPSPDLSGQWADGDTDQDVLDSFGYDGPEDNLLTDDLVDAWCMAYCDAAQDEIYAACRVTLEDLQTERAVA